MDSPERPTHHSRRKPVEYSEFDDDQSLGGYSNYSFNDKYGSTASLPGEFRASKLPLTIIPPGESAAHDRKLESESSSIYGDETKSQKSWSSKEDKSAPNTHQDTKKTSESKAEKDEFERSYMDVIRDFADSTSFTGIPFINRAGRWYSRLSWIVVFLIALSLWLFHSYFIISEYLEYGTTATTVIRYSQLAFPSVTLCNVNPVRQTKRNFYGTQEMNDFLDGLSPRTDYQTTDPSQTQAPGQSPPQKRKKRQTNTGTNPSNTGSSSNTGRQAPSDTSSSYDQFAVNQERHAEQFGGGNVSEHIQSELTFKQYYGELPEDNRTAIGHQKDIFILSCSFNGRECDIEEDFVLEQTTDYGNCYTFNSHSQRGSAYKSQRSGALYGLDLQLYIEDIEYVPGLKVERGVRMDVHAFDTIHNVAENGISIPPGKQTFIGMTLSELKRLGGVFGDCDDDDSFRDYYGYLYTMQGCLNTCLDRSISSMCGCYRKVALHKYNAFDLETLPTCDNDTTTSACAAAYELAFGTGQIGCGCNPACKSKEYDFLISNNNWPDSSQWFTMVDKVCSVDRDKCIYFRGITANEWEDELRTNFLNVKLYYRDLNYADIKQQEKYEQSQFISDLGGAIGLWVGASMITLLELLDLSFQCCHFACRKNRYTRRQKEQLRKRRFLEMAEAEVNGDEKGEKPEMASKVDLSDPPSYRSTEGSMRRPGLQSDTFI